MFIGRSRHGRPGLFGHLRSCRSDGAGGGIDAHVDSGPAGTTISRARQGLPDLCMLTLIGSDGFHLGRALSRVDLFLVALERQDQVANRVGPEDAGDDDDGSHPEARPGRLRNIRPALGQPTRPDVRVPTLVVGDPTERRGADRITLDPGEGHVQLDRVALESEVLEALQEVGVGHGPSVAGSAVSVEAMPRRETWGRRTIERALGAIARRYTPADDRNPAAATSLAVDGRCP